jgi:hypothetical protein
MRCSLDAELFDDGLEAGPAIKSTLCVGNFVTAHVSHSPDVGLSALLLVGRNCDSCEVDLEHLLQCGIVIDIFF